LERKEKALPWVEGTAGDHQEGLPTASASSFPAIDSNFHFHFFLPKFLYHSFFLSFFFSLRSLLQQFHHLCSKARPNHTGKD